MWAESLRAWTGTKNEHCGARAVIWDADFTFEDYGLEGEGIVHHCHCANCGAEIEYFISCEDEEE